MTMVGWPSLKTSTLWRLTSRCQILRCSDNLQCTRCQGTIQNEEKEEIFAEICSSYGTFNLGVAQRSQTTPDSSEGFIAGGID